MIIPNQKSISRSSFRPANAKVHIWHASLEQPEDVIQRLKAVLSEEERQRADELRSEEDKQSFVISRGILRNLLYHYTGNKPENILFKYTLTGKPVLDGDGETSDIGFNISHAGMLALYAFAWGRQVGIDVKQIRLHDKIDQIARQRFSENEYKRFQRVSEKDRLRAFYNCCARKDAFVKATEDGIYFPFQEFDVTFEPDLPAELLTLAGSREQAMRWSMHDIKTWEGYSAALVVEGNDFSMSHKQWTSPSFLPGS